jgi:hypothetical protein
MAGGVVLTFAWMGMAELAYVDGQMPFLVSGGAAGLALVIVGSTLVLSAAVSEAAEHSARRTAELLKQAADEAVEAQEQASAEPSEADVKSEAATV